MRFFCNEFSEWGAFQNPTQCTKSRILIQKFVKKRAAVSRRPIEKWIQQIDYFESLIKQFIVFIAFRWVPTLTSEDVADRIISSILRREKTVIIPSYLQFMLAMKW